MVTTARFSVLVDSVARSGGHLRLSRFVPQVNVRFKILHHFLELRDVQRLRAARPSSSSFDRESQSDGLGDRDQRGQTRIAADRQGPIKTLALDAGSSGNSGDAPRLREMPQRN